MTLIEAWQAMDQVDPWPPKKQDAEDDLVSRRIALGVRLKETEEAVAAIKEEIATLDAVLTEEWAQNGTHSIKRDNGMLYLHRSRWAHKLCDTTELIEALRASGDMQIINVNHMALTARLKELYDNDQPLPEALVGKVELVDKYSIRLRGAK